VRLCSSLEGCLYRSMIRCKNTAMSLSTNKSIKCTLLIMKVHGLQQPRQSFSSQAVRTCQPTKLKLLHLNGGPERTDFLRKRIRIAARHRQSKSLVLYFRMTFYLQVAGRISKKDTSSGVLLYRATASTCQRVEYYPMPRHGGRTSLLHLYFVPPPPPPSPLRVVAESSRRCPRIKEESSVVCNRLVLFVPFAKYAYEKRTNATSVVIRRHSIFSLLGRGEKKWTDNCTLSVTTSTFFSIFQRFAHF
jgi:hypothetical protein